VLRPLLYVFGTLLVTQAAVIATSVYLHRGLAHRALNLHPFADWIFRFVLWFTTGQNRREWVAVHRKHHAFTDTERDPHSPLVHGFWKIQLWNVYYYVREARNPETLARWAKDIRDDVWDRVLFNKGTLGGVVGIAAAMLVLGPGWGLLLAVSHFVLYVFVLAPSINGLGHWWGYRNFVTEDASTNMTPIAAWIGGEELHNNHHAYATSAKLSNKWYEIDLGWMYICLLEALGLAQVKKVAPTPRFTEAKPAVDSETLQAVITHRYDVLAKYAKSLKRTYAEELGKLRRLAPHDAHVLKNLKRWLHRDEKSLCETERANLKQGLAKSRALHTVYSMRAELASLWERSSASREQLVRQLQDWCHRAEASGIRPLAEFSHRLRRYA